MNRKSIILGGVIPLLLVATGVGVFVGMRPPTPSTLPEIGSDRGSLLGQMPAADVRRVRALAELSETLDIPVTGTVVPFREIELAAEAAGRVIEKDATVRSGNFVSKDQVLLRIDPRDYELEIEQLTRRREQELATLAELEQDVENAERLIEVAEEEYQLAGAEVKRFEGLGPTIASAAEMDQARRSLLASRSQTVNLQNQLRALRASGARMQLAAKLAETQIEQARLNLERTVVRAPVDGRIVSEQVEKDSFVQKGAPLLVIEDTEKVEVALNLRMNQLYWVLDRNDLSADQLVNAAAASRYELPRIPVKVQFQMSGRESTLFEWDGVLDRYDGLGIDPQSRTVPVRVLVDRPSEYRVNGEPRSTSSRNGPSTLVRGMFVDVKLLTRPATELLLVPKLSIKPSTGSNRIWKFVPDEAAYEVVKKKVARPSDASKDPVPLPDAPDESANTNSPTALDPTRWQAGFLQVLDGVHVVGPYEPEGSNEGRVGQGDQKSPPSDAADKGTRAESDYWICEVRGGGLLAGDKVVVTPLPGVQGDGTDTIRVPRSEEIGP